MLSKVYSRQDQDRSDDSHSQGPCVAMRNLSQLRDYNYQLRQEELPPARNSNQTPCVQSVSATIPASNPQVRNGCGCAAAQARRTSTRWLIPLPWQLRWPPFCMVLTPAVLPNSFGVPPDLPVPYLFQARGLPRYGFCALETPQALLISICLFVGCSFCLFCSSLPSILYKSLGAV